MPLNDEVRLRHLVEAARKAVSYAAGRSRADLDDDELLRLALTKLDDMPRLLAILPGPLNH